MASVPRGMGHAPLGHAVAKPIASAQAKAVATFTSIATVRQPSGRMSGSGDGLAG